MIMGQETECVYDLARLANGKREVNSQICGRLSSRNSERFDTERRKGVSFGGPSQDDQCIFFLLARRSFALHAITAHAL